MATTTPNYLWSVPTSSDLVKNGATAIETLGDSVDASLWNSGYGQAGKNKIINGDFGVNQRGFTSTTTNTAFTFDRFIASMVGGTVTFTAQTFTLGSAPEAGYEGKNYIDIASTGQSAAGDLTRFIHRIESVRTFAGQTVTVSFWAKAISGTPKVALELQQIFGTGGSPSAAVSNYLGQATLTTSWARYSLTVAIPSISGKTIGTANDDYVGLNIYTSAGSSLNSRTGSLGIQTTTISLWGIQAEIGSVATPFQTASGGSPQVELAMCQRYYFRGGNGAYSTYGTGFGTSTTTATLVCPLPVEMRVVPTAVDFSNICVVDSSTRSAITALGLGVYSSKTTGGAEATTGIGLTLLRPYFIQNNNNAAGYIGFSAEL